MKTIPLTNGRVALIDEEDFEKLKDYKWHARKTGNNWYAGRSVALKLANGKMTSKTISLHRVILDLTDPNLIIDHANGNGLDNRRSNLRIVSKQQNSTNRTRRESTNTSGFRGVTVSRIRPPHYRARLSFNNKRIHLGYFFTLEEAARAYDKAARAYHGEYCGLLNFPDKIYNKGPQ